jgi:hypothetical protein
MSVSIRLIRNLKEWRARRKRKIAWRKEFLRKVAIRVGR